MRKLGLKCEHVVEIAVVIRDASNKLQEYIKTYEPRLRETTNLQYNLI